MEDRFSSLRLDPRPFLMVIVAFLVLGAIALACPGSARSAAATFAWDANTEPTLGGYKVYYGTSSRAYTTNVNVGNWTSCTISGLTEGRTYYFAATAYNTAGLESSYSSEVSYTVPGVVTPPPSSSAVSFAVNAGGPQYTAGSIAYSADTKYSGGRAYQSSATISGTSDQTLYRTQRLGNFSYNIPLANGNYNLTLKFAELSIKSRSRRVFNVLVGGRVVISRLDVYARAGANRAYDVTIPVSVTSGTLNIQFRSVYNNAIVNAVTVSK